MVQQFCVLPYPFQFVQQACLKRRIEALYIRLRFERQDDLKFSSSDLLSKGFQINPLSSTLSIWWTKARQ